MSIDFCVQGVFTCCDNTHLAFIKTVEAFFIDFLRTIPFNRFCAFKTLNFQRWPKDEKVSIINTFWQLLRTASRVFYAKLAPPFRSRLAFF